jgi:hypothetical protein
MIQTLFKTPKIIPEKEDMIPGTIMPGIQILPQLILIGEIMPEARLTITTIPGDGVLLGVGVVIMAAITLIGDMAAVSVGVLDFHGVAHGVGVAAGIWVGDIHLIGEDIIHIGAAIMVTVILIGDMEDIMVEDIGEVITTDLITEEAVPTEEDLILTTEGLPINMV